MAHIIPSDITRLALAGGHGPELDTLVRLRDGLADDYTVFHGVHWTREYQGWTHFGEIDFVVLNRSGDVLLVEQKNGTLEESGGDLVKHYGEGHRRGAVEQLHRSIDKVRQKFQWRHGRDTPLAVDYLFYCPDHRVRDLNAVGMDPSRIVDAAQAPGLASRIADILGPGLGAGNGSFKRVHDFFCQTFEVVPDIHAHLSAQERAYVRQTGVLAAILTGLRMTPFRLRVMGTAGSGKSLVARHFFARAEAEGRRVLLVCFNRPLAERLKAQLGGGGHVSTWYGLCDAFLQSRGVRLDFDRMKTEPGFWDRVAEQVTAEVIPEAWRFDALVVDEGQDFDQEWFEILQLFLREGADILWLEDPEQNLQGRAPVETPGFMGYECRVNYRSPDSIARFIRTTLPYEFDPGNSLPGLGVGVHAWDAPEDQPRLVAHQVKSLLRQGFAHEDIAILTCGGVNSSVFSALEAVGGEPLRRFTGEYDAYGNQRLTEGRLLFDSVYRFKGQEAPAVILVDVDPAPESLERDLRLIYCGMTRATVRLELLLRGDNPENRRFREA